MKYQKYHVKYFGKVTHGSLSFSKRLFLKLTSSVPVSRYYYELMFILNCLPKGSKVLDVGCSHGGFLNFLHNLRPDLNLYGTDLSDVSNLLPKNVTFIQADFINDTFDETDFDLIISRHLIEHLNVFDVPLFFQKAYTLLKDGGKCFILCPNLSYDFYKDPTHVRPYNKFSLRRLFEMSNFVKIKSFDCQEFPFRGMKLSIGWAIK